MTKPRADQADPTPDLSEAARAVVRDPGDPRTDAFLAALGLGDDPRPAEPARGSAPVSQAADRAELEALRTRVRELETALSASALHARTLGMALVAAIVTAAALLFLLYARPG